MRLFRQLSVVAAVSIIGALCIELVGWNAPLTLVLGLATAVLAVAAYAWVVQRTERRKPVEVALNGAPAALGRGVLIGLGWFVLVIVAIAVSGGYEVRGWGSVAGTVAILGYMAAPSVTEELLFRGVLFRIVEERFGTWMSLVLSGLLFGLIHIGNPNATLWSTFAIAVEAGFLLGAAYAATRNLWVPIGIHFGWNFAQGGIFGASVSGLDMPRGLLDGVTSGPVVVSGGAFGPEASGFSLLAGVLLTVVFLRLARRRGNIKPRRARTAPAATLAA